MLYQSGSWQCPNNYCPIRLTSIIKIFESIVKDFVFNHLKSHELISNMQYGFIPKRSCKSQLLSVLNKWTSILKSGDSVDVIYLHFSKAFASTPHLRLLNKLYSYGFRGRLLQWLKG